MKIAVPILTVAVSVSATYLLLSHFVLSPLSLRLEKLEMRQMATQPSSFQDNEIGYHMTLKKQMQTVVEMLGLSDPKKERVLKIGISFIPQLYKASKEEGDNTQTQIDEIMNELERAIEPELTPQQMQRYREILNNR